MSEDDKTPPQRPALIGDVPTLAQCVLDAARETVGVKETTRNSGPEIDLWLATVSLPPGRPWCAAWLYSMFLRATRALGIPNPCPRTGAALRMYTLADDAFKITASVAFRNDLIVPGMAFFEDHSTPEHPGIGHCGLVVGLIQNTDLVMTISGNTNVAGSREGDSVVERGRPVSRMLGFLDFSRTPTLLT